jgi:Rrf2 family protein
MQGGGEFDPPASCILKMKLSAKTEYACLAMLQMAREYENPEPLQIRRIADEQGIPARFLVQILLQLKGASLVASTRGAAGGYRLARPPQQISLAEVIEVIEGDDRPATNAGKPTPLVGALLVLCRELSVAQRDRLEDMTLTDLVERAARREPMWYI